jgi:putative RecB family exonuclease
MTNVLAIAEREGGARPGRPDMQEMVEHVAAGGSPYDYVEPPDWFSYSSFDMFERCPRQYALRYLCRLQVETPRPAAEFGSTAHAAFEAFTRARRESRAGGDGGAGRLPAPDRVDLERFFEAAWAASSLASEPDAAAWRARAEPMLDRFWAAESEGAGPAAGPIETIGEEVRFRLRLTLDQDALIAVGGFIDRVDRLPSGAAELIDYKTGSPWTPEDVETSLQLSIYALGCRDALELGRPERVTLNFVEHDLRFSAARTDAALDELRSGLVRRAGEIRGSDFAPKPGPRSCGWCDFAAICGAR